MAGMTNTNLVRKNNELQAAIAEVRTRQDRGKDDDGNFNLDVFRVKNPDIKEEPQEWLTRRTEEIRKLRAELAGYRDSEAAFSEIDDMVREDQKAVNRPPVARGGGGAAKLSSLILGSEDYKAFREEKRGHVTIDLDADLKALFDSSTGWPVDTVRTDRLVMLPQRRVTMLDILPTIQSDIASIEYLEQTTDTSPADMGIAEGDAYGESTLAFDERTISMIKRGAYIQVSEETLDNEARTRGRIDGALLGQMRRNVEMQCVNGAGTGASVTGFLTKAGLNEVVATDMNTFEAITNGIEMVWSDGEADTDVILMNRKDWTKWIQSQEITGGFINGMPAMAFEQRIAGVPVVFVNALPAGTALLGDFMNQVELLYFRDIQVRIQEAQRVASGGGTTTPTGRFNIFTDARFALAIYQPKAFCKVTNLP